jgi:hypothetical protein
MAVVLSGSNDFDILLLCSVKLLLVRDDFAEYCAFTSSFLPILFFSAYFEYKSRGTLISLCIGAEADELPVTMGKLSIGDIAEVPEVYDVFVDKMEEQGTDVKAFES